jgi:hypothetical protein
LRAADLLAAGLVEFGVTDWTRDEVPAEYLMGETPDERGARRGSEMALKTGIGTGRALLVRKV